MSNLATLLGVAQKRRTNVTKPLNRDLETPLKAQKET